MAALLFVAAGLVSTPAPVTGAVIVPPESAILDGLRAGHPRLILTPDGITDLQARIAADPTVASMYGAVKARATALLGEPVLTYVKPDGYRLLETSRAAVRRMYDLGLVWLVEGDAAYAARGWAELEAVTAFPDWNPIHFLDTAEMTHAVAIGYDWLYAALTPPQRSTVEQALITKGLVPARDSYDGSAPIIVSYWTAVTHNWNNVVNGGMTIGALALGDVDPTLSRYVAHEALTRLPGAVANYAPDGGWPEGVSYWEYATEYTGYTITALQTALGGDFGLSDEPGFAATGDVPIHMTGPSGQRFNWADDGEPRFAPSVPFLFWLADRFDRPAFHAYQSSHAEPHALDVVWYRPAPGPPEDVPLDRLFAGVDVATMRSAWGDPAALWVAAKGGVAAENHNQLDLGSFVLESGGERFAIDPGKENYNLPGYWENWPSGRRWTYYRSRAEGHNTLVIDPDGCEDQDPGAVATITRFASSADDTFAVTDLSNAYRLPATRGVGQFDRDHVVVQDELALGDGAEVWWFMHTRAEIQIVDGGRTAVLTQNGRVLRAHLTAPDGATFSIEEPVPLPTSPNPDGQTPNTGVRKLAVHLHGTGDVTLAVTFSPDGVDPPPDVTPLAAWHVDGQPTADVTRPAVVTAASPSPCDPPTPATEPTTAPPAAPPATNAAVLTPVFAG